MNTLEPYIIHRADATLQDTIVKFLKSPSTTAPNARSSAQSLKVTPCQLGQSLEALCV